VFLSFSYFLAYLRFPSNTNVYTSFRSLILLPSVKVKHLKVMTNIQNLIIFEDARQDVQLDANGIYIVAMQGPGTVKIKQEHYDNEELVDSGTLCEDDDAIRELTEKYFDWAITGKGVLYEHYESHDGITRKWRGRPKTSVRVSPKPLLFLKIGEFGDSEIAKHIDSKIRHRGFPKTARLKRFLEVTIEDLAGAGFIKPITPDLLSSEFTREAFNLVVRNKITYEKKGVATSKNIRQV